MSVESLADAVESALDETGFENPHVVGNSLGGWLALELARRGRARTVTAVSPAGAWRNPFDLVRMQLTLSVSGRAAALPLTGAVLSPFLRSPAGRRLVFRQLMERGDRMSAPRRQASSPTPMRAPCSPPSSRQGVGTGRSPSWTTRAARSGSCGGAGTG